MSKQKAIMIILLLVLMAIFIPPIIKRISLIRANIPKDRTELVFKDNKAYIELKLEKAGCYEIGLYSKTNTFVGFIMESPNLMGDYILTYSNNKTKNGTFSKDAKVTGFTRVGKTSKHSTLMLDLLDGKTANLSVVLNITNADQKMTDDDIYFYCR